MLPIELDDDNPRKLHTPRPDFKPSGRLERDRTYDLIVHVPRLLIVELVDLGGRDQLG